jgi:hypothetical protein
MALDVGEVATVLSDLTALNYFPADDGGRLAVVKLVCAMASDMGQVRWLVNRVLTLFNGYPGPRDLRAVFCSRFAPADGLVVRTCEYFMGKGESDGIVPAEYPPLIWSESAGAMIPAGAQKGPMCPACGGTGWRVVERGAVSGAAPCSAPGCNGRGWLPLGSALRLLEMEKERAAATVAEVAEVKAELRDSLDAFAWPASAPRPAAKFVPPSLDPSARAVLEIRAADAAAELRAVRAAPHAVELGPAPTGLGLCVRCWLPVSHPVHDPQ